MPITYKQDFLLTVETYNHEIITQTPDDKSRTDPTRTFYYDIKDLPIKRASLIGKGHILTIDLETGNGEIDGRILYPPQGSRPPEIKDRKLIYYKQVQQNTNLGVEMRNNKNRLLPKWLRKDNPIPAVKYYIGWQVNYKGKNYKWELGIS